MTWVVKISVQDRYGVNSRVGVSEGVRISAYFYSVILFQVRAMRFPPKSYNKELESAEERREREAQDLELAKEMAEDDDDAY